jgi:CheY-like chemotaxis protein
MTFRELRHTLIASTPDRPASNGSENDAMPVTDANPKVLVVEDEALLLFSIADDLKEAGFDVLEASNADEAIRILTAHPEIELLFTDVDMPGSMDGLKLSAMVRNRWPPVRIIVTSGKQQPDQTTLPSGGLFIPKPYMSRQIAAAMREMLA